MFRASCAIIIFSLSTLCHCIHQPHHHQQFGPQRYEIEEDPAKQTVPASYHRTYPSSSRQTYDHNQLNQFYQLQQLNQLQQLQQQQQAAYAAASPQTQQAAYASNPQTQQYLASLQQFYAASKQPQNAYTTAQAQAAAPQSQYVPQAAQQQQQGYPAPLGVLYSAASDVSQFQFSGNGVNYSF